MEYSAKIISELFWLQESRKTAGYLLKGYDKAAIRKIAWNENIYQVKAEYRAYDVLNGTYRRIAELPEVVLKTFTSCDVETAKILNAFPNTDKQFIIQCSFGSYAEEHARKNKFKYQLV